MNCCSDHLLESLSICMYLIQQSSQIKSNSTHAQNLSAPLTLHSYITIYNLDSSLLQIQGQA